MDFSARHSFAVNKPFLSKKAGSPQDYLDAVLEVEKNIAKYAVENENEIFWKQDFGNAHKVDVSIGYGTAGIAYFYLQLYEATKNERHAEIVKKAVCYIKNHWRQSIPPEPHRYTWPDGMHYGIYSGISGTGSFLILAEKAFGLKDAQEAIDDILDYLKKKSVPVKLNDGNAAGIKWTGSPVSLADGGILMFLASLYETRPSEELKEFLESAGNAYLASGIEHENGGLEFSDYETCKLSEPDYPYKVSQPNFELGSAGAGFVLGRLYQALGEKKYLDAAVKVERYLDTVKIEQKKGFLLPYRVGDVGDPIFYLGNCHGAAGTAKFYYLIYRLTKNNEYLEKVNQLFDGFESLGAPVKMSAGLWNNTSVCCGQGGILNTAIGLKSTTGQSRWNDLAKQAAEILLGEKDEVEPSHYGWPIAYRRIAPTEFSYTIFYNDGTAGSAAALLRIYFSETGRKNSYSLADDPFIE